MSWGLRVWRNDGFLVLDLDSKHVGVLRYGSVSLNPLPPGNTFTIPIPNRAKYASRMVCILTANGVLLKQGGGGGPVPYSGDLGGAWTMSYVTNGITLTANSPSAAALGLKSGCTYTVFLV